MLGDAIASKKRKRENRREGGRIREIKERNREKREKKREKREKIREKERKRYPGSIIINLHSILKKKNKIYWH